MIILNTINHDNKIEYHFTNDNYKGVAFKILASFDAVEEDGEHYLTCEYEQLNHNLNEHVLSDTDLKLVCDEFVYSLLQSLMGAISTEANKLVGELDVN